MIQSPPPLLPPPPSLPAPSPSPTPAASAFAADEHKEPDHAVFATYGSCASVLTAVFISGQPLIAYIAAGLGFLAGLACRKLPAMPDRDARR